MQLLSSEIVSYMARARLNIIYVMFSIFCSFVTLQDVLENEQFKLDAMFKFSLMQDIVRVSHHTLLCLE